MLAEETAMARAIDLAFRDLALDKLLSSARHSNGE